MNIIFIQALHGRSETKINARRFMMFMRRMHFNFSGDCKWCQYFVVLYPFSKMNNLSFQYYYYYNVIKTYCVSVINRD